jgi:GT2 family glycosyltransferase
VVVLTWNGLPDTLACLESLERAGHPKAGEAFVVVDNGSTDGTLDVVRARFPWAETIQNGANLGFAGGNNAGMRWALDKGFDYVMLLNNDTDVPEGSLERLVAFLDGHPDAGAVQALLVSYGDRGRIDSTGVELFSMPGARDRHVGRAVKSVPEGPQEVFGACAAAAVYRAAALVKTGLLDEDFFVLLEDVDLSFRVRLAGYSIYLIPEAPIYHKRGISSQGKISGAKKFILYRNIRALAIRYWPRRDLVLYWPILFRGWLWGRLYALGHRRTAEWNALMKKSRAIRRAHGRDPAWRAIQKDWMYPLGLSYYWKKVRERLTGKPALP